MDDERHKKEMEELKKVHEKTLEGLGLQNEGYRCYDCGNRVSYMYILPFIKSSGLCPDCWHKDPEEREEDKILARAEEIKEKREKK